MDADALVSRLKDGDVLAFEVLYERYNRLVLRVARHIAGDLYLAEDVRQTVFLTLWRSSARYTSGNFAGWLARLTRNRTIDVLRQKPPLADRTPTALPSSEATDDLVWRSVDASSVRVALTRALTLVPRKQRQAIELSFLQHMTHIEIAHELGLPLGTVKTRVRSGLAHLRLRLAAGSLERP